MPARRRSTGKRRLRPPLAALLCGFLLTAFLVYGFIAVERQIGGYFSSSQRHAAQSRRLHLKPRRPGPDWVAPATPQATSHTSAAERRSTAFGVSAAAPSPSAGASGAAHKTSQQPRVAVIIDDCGNNLERDRRFLQLPIALTLSVLPMSSHGREIAAEAVSAGKAVMLHLPMQPESRSENPGPGAITADMTDDAIASQVDADIASLPKMPGANNHMGSKATSDPRVMRDVIEAMQRNHLFFIDSMTSGSSVGLATARSMGVPTAARDVFLDNSATLTYVEGQLRTTMSVALKNGDAIAIGHPNAATAEALDALIPEMESAGISFVTAQTLVR